MTILIQCGLRNLWMALSKVKGTYIIHIHLNIFTLSSISIVAIIQSVSWVCSRTISLQLLISTINEFLLQMQILSIMSHLWESLFSWSPWSLNRLCSLELIWLVFEGGSVNGISKGVIYVPLKIALFVYINWNINWDEFSWLVVLWEGEGELMLSAHFI